MVMRWASYNPCRYGSSLTLEVTVIFSGTARVGTMRTDISIKSPDWILMCTVVNGMLLLLG